MATFLGAVPKGTPPGIRLPDPPLVNSSPPKPGSMVSKRTAGNRVCIEVSTAEPIAVIRSGIKLSIAWLSATLSSVGGWTRKAAPEKATIPIFTLAGRSPFSRLVYPVPEPGGLGVHLTLDMAGQARFGPDVEWVDEIDYAVDPARAQRFYPAIRRYWPTLPDGALMPSYSGIRPKIVSPAVAVQDFLIQGPKDHGIGGLINLFGIESPGLTSSLAIADYVAGLVQA